MKTLDENAVGGQWKWGYSNTIFSSRIYIYIPIQKHTKTIADWTFFFVKHYFIILYICYRLKAGVYQKSKNNTQKNKSHTKHQLNLNMALGLTLIPFLDTVEHCSVLFVQKLTR